MFKTLLIANRGEIACRIIKTARRLGIESVAIYSTADRDSLHVRMADKAFCVGEPEARASYLNIPKIIEVAIQSGADAIHPGYGFLSENPEFAEACAIANLTFVGPSISAIQAMASKQLSKQLLAKTNVPLTPGYHGDDQTDVTLLQQAIEIGFPILLKAANGGGGKGMRIVSSKEEFKSSLESARREALASFGNDIMIIEKYIVQPRHVEIQLMADNFNHVVHLFERDCSIQRRHQKIVEEAPAPNFSKQLRLQLAEAAIAVAKAIDYRGAGTVEFLVDAEETFYFMEMNTRLQVEHPVTEMITGLDLVEWQLLIANNEPLPLTQDHINAKGHAVECRINAEDAQQFIPSTGTIHFLKEPKGEGVRIDTGITKLSQISIYYDPMIAKLVTWGESREEAIQRMQQALKHYEIGGVKTNIPLLKAILQHPKFQACDLSTDFLNQHALEMTSPDFHQALMLAASIDYLRLNPPFKTHLQTDTFGWQMHLKRHWFFHYRIHHLPYTLTITPIDFEQFKITYDDQQVTLIAKSSKSEIWVDDGQQIYRGSIDDKGNLLHIYMPSGSITVERSNESDQIESQEAMNHRLTSPMPATVVAVLKNKGDATHAGDRLMVLEAMKMEHTILAPADGIIDDIFFNVGDQVAEGVELMALKDKVFES